MRISCRTPAVAALVLGTLWASAPSEAAAQRQHTVRSGQSFSVIARRYHVSAWDLAMANDMRPEAMLRPGHVLVVPPAGVTYVRPGQTLSHIAAEHHCSVPELARLNRIRGSLRAGQRLTLPGYDAASEEAGTRSAPRDWGPPAERGVVAIRRHDGVTRVRLIDAEGRVTRDGLLGLGRLMQRHAPEPPPSGDAVAAAVYHERLIQGLPPVPPADDELPHPRLVRLIAALSDHFGGREITLVSGRREAGGYTRETSRHVSGQATDIRISGVANRALWDYCRSLDTTGCGYYPRSTFVHVDVRDRPAQWVDWSTPGRRARYGNLTRPWPRACRAARAARTRRCLREGRSITRPDDVPRVVELEPSALDLMPEVPSIAAQLDEPIEEASDEEPGES